MMQRRYGWRPDVPDQRDHLFAAPPRAPLPKTANLSPLVTRVFDQGELGSCTANAIATAFIMNERQQVSQPMTPSRLFIYYNERAMEGTIREDAGAMIRDGIKSVAKQGVCAEQRWPYIISKFTQKPPAALYREALEHQVLAYARVPRDLRSFRAALARGYPIVFGFSVYESFENAIVAKTGVAPLPRPSERLLGGHAVVAVGYTDVAAKCGRKTWPANTLLCQNSWGAAWGYEKPSGCFSLPYGYIESPDLSDDFWTIKTVER